MPDPSGSPAAALARRHDPERFLAALTAPAERRESLFAVLALEFEIARTREVVSEPLLGEIRLQWWDDALAAIAAGRPTPPHEFLAALAGAIREHGVEPELLRAMVEARRRDLDDAPPATLDDLVAYAAATGGAVARALAQALGGNDRPSQDAARDVGTAWSLVGLLRALPHQARRNRMALPADALAAAGLTPHDVAAGRGRERIRPIVAAVAAVASDAIGRARTARPPRATLPALLPARLAAAHLRRLARAAHDPFDARLRAPDGWRAMRVAWGAWTRRF
ncbi:MAG: squalene/phytoene synthase family protein [Alphaproteobacteria bacterium]|nr:squalene/phytoene synthase family protein [Alphaproteobacteria bacterium]